MARPCRSTNANPRRSLQDAATLPELLGVDLAASEPLFEDLQGAATGPVGEPPHRPSPEPEQNQNDQKSGEPHQP